jgi:hypothetical protein
MVSSPLALKPAGEGRKNLLFVNKKKQKNFDVALRAPVAPERTPRSPPGAKP